MHTALREIFSIGVGRVVVCLLASNAAVAVQDIDEVLLLPMG